MAGSAKAWFGGVLIAVLLAIAGGQVAHAGDFIPYTKERLQALQASGDKPILVFINANWCPICAKERPIVAKLIGANVGGKQFDGDPALMGMDCIYIDFDAQRDAWRSFGATEQSTLIVFRGTTEVGRAVGMTNPDDIKALLLKAVAKS
jgi:thiol-disulfide isomerase/thioredoxin